MTVKSICESIGKLIDTIRIPLPSIPAVLIACGAINRPGLSSMMIASEIIRRQTEAGAIPGALPDGSPSVAEAMERIRVEAIVNAIKNDMKVESVLAPGSIVIQNVDGSIGTNTTYVKADGIGR